MKFGHLKRVLFLVAILSVSVFSYATAAENSTIDQGTVGEAYALPTFREMAQTYLMLGGIDVRDPYAADEYAKLIYCDLYRTKFKDDFEWNKIREKIVRDVTDKKEYYRVLYEFSGQVLLGRYNFDTQDFPFVNGTAFINIGTMAISDKRSSTQTVSSANKDIVQIERICDDQRDSLYFPYTYFVKLSQPLTFDRLKIPGDQAERLLAKMKDMRNDKRTLYVRFRVRLTGVANVRSVNQTVKKARLSAIYKGEIMVIDLFIDPAMTELVTSVPISDTF